MTRGWTCCRLSSMTTASHSKQGYCKSHPNLKPSGHTPDPPSSPLPDLMATCVAYRYERLGLWGLAMEAYASILQQLRHASDPSMLHMGPQDRTHCLQAEPFPPEWQRLPLHAWVDCAAVWRARAEDYVKARSYIMAAALYRKVGYISHIEPSTSTPPVEADV